MVINMNDRISITDLARLRNVTTETLRHYDRIGLFKPTYVDPKTGYRYYSILQYEKLGTIKELRQLGMALEEIKQYFDNRSVNKSLNILTSEHKNLKKKIAELHLLEKAVSEKIKFLKNVIKDSKEKEVVLKHFSDREIITFGKIINDDIELSYGVLELENSLEEIAPILASNRIGLIISKEDIEASNFMKSSGVFVFSKGIAKVDKKYIRTLKSGTYACIYHNGKPWNRTESIAKLIEFIDQNGYIINGDAVQVVQIDITVTDLLEEESIEIQIPIIV
jgi:DNA-binding transcriptional MerR regulator